jgi:hypothetical protein
MALTQVSSGLISSIANTQVTGLGTMSIQNSGNVSITGGNVATTGLTVSGNAVFNSTGYMVVPVGTTGQRPGTNTQGSLRYNSSTNTLEINNGTSFSGVGGSAPGSDIFLAINYGAL